ncbi:cadherin domain-containing protein [Gammaproteobacteria bacterium AS21]
MPNHIATVQTVTGVVKAVSAINGERTLRPGDFIYDDDILTTNQYGSNITTTNGLTITLDNGEIKPPVENDSINFINNLQVTGAGGSADFTAGINDFQSDKQEISPPVEPSNGARFYNAYRVNDQNENGYVRRLASEVTPQLFSFNDNNTENSNRDQFNNPRIESSDLLTNNLLIGSATLLVNEPISMISDMDLNANRILENSLIGTTVGITASATDNDAVYYNLSVNPNDLFEINNLTGVVSLAGILDFETVIKYTIEITATSEDGTQEKKVFTIDVTNVNELAEFTLFDVDNNHAVISTAHQLTHIVAKVSDDEGINYSASTISALHGTATIDSLTGNILYTSNDNNLTDTLTLVVVDNEGGITSKQIPVSINVAPDSLTVQGSSNLFSNFMATPTISGETDEVDLSTPGTILQTGQSNWGTTITSANSVLASKGVSVEFQSLGSGNAGMWGLNISGQTATTPLLQRY